MLAHSNDDCTGYWRLHEHTIVCTGCGRTHAGTPRNRAAAMDENFASSMLQRATSRGSLQLTRERA